MNSVTESGDFSAYTGWRSFDDTANFGWLKGDFVSGIDPEASGWIEVSISYAVLFPNGEIPEGGTSIGGFTAIGNNYGNAFSNQSLPQTDTETVTGSDSVWTIDLEVYTP